MSWDKQISDGNFKWKVFGVVSRFFTEKSLETWEVTWFSKEKCKY